MKNIVFLADGTWNGPGQTDDPPQTTNVFKLFSLLAGRDDPSSLALAKEQERVLSEAGTVTQVAKYLHGVGDSSNVLVKLLGGAFGAGVITRIVRGYTFISRNYEDGDRIFIVGFSRGAYTARSLAGLIAARGLLAASDCTDKEQAYRIGASVWAEYRSERKEDLETKSLLHDVFKDLPSFLDPLSARAAKPSQALRKVNVDAVAVWDTVGALGLPVYDSDDQRKDVFKFCDRSLSERVRKGYHAVSISEQREDFCPTLWQPREGITQMLFAGAHADVGGGYPQTNEESGLAHVSLQWMCDLLEADGLNFQHRASDVYPATAYGPSHAPWLEFPWKFAPVGPRTFDSADQLLVHPSVKERMGRGPYPLLPGDGGEPFAPQNLP